MFKNKHIDGKCNRCGEQIAKLRKQLPDKTSQRILADRMQEKGIDMDKNAIQRIEHGDRFVTDIELAAFADFFGVSSDVLLGKKESEICSRVHPHRKSWPPKCSWKGLTLIKTPYSALNAASGWSKTLSWMFSQRSFTSALMN